VGPIHQTVHLENLVHIDANHIITVGIGIEGDFNVPTASLDDGDGTVFVGELCRACIMGNPRAAISAIKKNLFISLSCIRLIQ